MRITSSSEYGMRIMIQMSHQREGKSLSAENLSQMENIPRYYMDQILMKLRRAKLVASLRGARGGFVLGRSPARISVGDVIRAVEGKVVEGKVFDETCKKYDHGSQMCCHTSRCSIRPVWLRLAQTIENFLNDISLAQLLHQEPRVLALLRRQPPVLLK